ncbi:DUF1707 domain-containing protein [Nocardioides sp.]|uniref:DUF1707 SHOCT-like domain-containing protein n=1 Tax=Nocardioides sp. TaxID=35761 RepID=UPI00356A35E0
MDGNVWESFAHDPREPALAPLRASDADRELIHGVLAEAFAHGRLTRTEYDERSTAVLEARTLGELPPIVADLVPALPARPSSGHVPLLAATATDIRARAEEHWLNERRNAFFGFVGPSLICWVIWLATGANSLPWPAIVMAVTLLNFLKVATNHREVVAKEVRRLERKRAKELGRSEES